MKTGDKNENFIARSLLNPIYRYNQPRSPSPYIVVSCDYLANTMFECAMAVAESVFKMVFL
jgi:hypothetical protein